jgi:hypothetical protein
LEGPTKQTGPFLFPVLELMASKTAILLKARTFSDMGMAETGQPMWTAAASYEERIAPLLDALGRKLEAAASRISAASCYAKAGDLSRAVNLYQAALTAALCQSTRRDVEEMLAGCLDELSRTALNGSSQRGGQVPAGVARRGRFAFLAGPKGVESKYAPSRRLSVRVGAIRASPRCL